MGKKAEVGTPKYLANKMKSKGLQKLRWYCQMCQKQCRDQNGFKCHTMSESHQRQLLLFADQPNRFLGEFSHEFESCFLNLLKRGHGTKRVFANAVYQEYISDKNHVHMNATRWESLSGFVQYLGRTGKCVVDHTDKGWYIAWIDRDPDTIARQEALQRKEKMAKDDDERLAHFISKQVEKGKKSADDHDRPPEFTELNREEDGEKIKLNLAKKVQAKKLEGFSMPSSSSASSRKIKEPKKKKMSALDEIMESDKKAKSSEKRWIRPGIVVKIITKSLGDKYYKQKGHVKEVVGQDGMGAVVVLHSGAKMKLDQSHLETVVPAEGRSVIILDGPLEGEEAEMKGLDFDNFSAKLKILRTGEKVNLPYESFSKIYKE